MSDDGRGGSASVRTGVTHSSHVGPVGTCAAREEMARVFCFPLSISDHLKIPVFSGSRDEHVGKEFGTWTIAEGRGGPSSPVGPRGASPRVRAPAASSSLLPPGLLGALSPGLLERPHSPHLPSPSPASPSWELSLHVNESWFFKMSRNSTSRVILEWPLASAKTCAWWTLGEKEDESGPGGAPEPSQGPPPWPLRRADLWVSQAMKIEGPQLTDVKMTQIRRGSH